MPPSHLGGTSRKEATREEVLEAARREREARAAARTHARCVLVIQAAWRASRSRRATRAEWLRVWRERYARTATRPGDRISSAALSEGALPLLLHALAPPRSATAAARARRAPAAGAPLVPAPGGETEALRGTLALLLRSYASREDSYWAAAGSADVQTRRTWVRRSAQLLQLCARCCCSGGGSGGAGSGAPGTSAAASAAGGGQPDITAVAAARCMVLLLDASAWKGEWAGGPEAASSCAQLRLNLACQPMALLAATARVAAAAAAASASASASGATGVQQRRSPLAGESALLNRLVLCCLLVAEAALEARGAQHPAALLQPSRVTPRDRQQQREQRQQEQQQQQQQQQLVGSYVQRLVTVLLPVPGLVLQLDAPNRARLLAPPLLPALLAAARACAEGAAAPLRGAAALPSLANLVQLLVVAPAAAPSPDACTPRAVYHLPASPALAGPAAASAYAAAATRLLAAAAAAAAAAAGGGGRREGVAEGAEVQRLWPLASQAHAVQMLEVLGGGGEGGGMACLAGYWLALLQDLPALAQTARTPAPTASASAAAAAADAPSAAADAAPSALNTLAFAPPVLPALWRWLALELGLPLEAPLAASRGLDVAALGGGCDALPGAAALVLGLFCRLYSHLQRAMDDTDFHARRAPFGTDAARAIATCLNSLVYHTFFTKEATEAIGRGAHGAGDGGGGLTEGARALALRGSPPVEGAAAAPAAPPPDTLRRGRALLRAEAPVALRALYERDSRRAFCQPQLWLAPHQGDSASGSGGGAPHRTPAGAAAGATSRFSIAAIVASMFGGGGDEEGARLQARAGEGQRPASVAALLRVAPQCVPFQERVQLFRGALLLDKERGRWAAPVAAGGRPSLRATIRRTHLLEDAFAQLGALGPRLKSRLQITFVNSAGAPEAGLDHGGLTKELLEAVVAAGTDPQRGLFAAAEGSGLAWPSPLAARMPQGLALLEFIGAVVGKALYEGILLDLGLAPFFIARLQGRALGMDDLASLDPELYRSLVQVKTYEGDVADLGLDFTASDEWLGATRTVELLPGGASLAVTAHNRLLYTHLLADHHLNRRLGPACAAFARGLGCMLPLAAVQMFSPGEVNQLISGGQSGGLDVEDMRSHATLTGGYTPSSSTVQAFWRVVAEMGSADRAALLRFITGTSRAPLGGFQHLQPPLTIQKVPCPASPLAALGGADVDRLPTASTCYSTLKLPNYRRASTLKAKLLQAIHAAAGFELS